MRKNDETTHPQSCLNKARSVEMLFVLLARDPAAPAPIRAWIGERLRLGKNNPDDPQIREAEETAAIMEAEQASSAYAGRH